MISNYERQYIDLCKRILNTGYKTGNRTGIDTIKLPHQIIQVDLQKEFPILKSKHVAFKTLTKEILWIMHGDNDVKHLQEQNCHVWDQWQKSETDSTIGTVYGWVVKHFNLVENLIHDIKTNPNDRRMMINLWQSDYLAGGTLPPCCFLSMWDVTDGKLNCMLVQRSGDVGLGVPFNTTQYAVLTHLIAHVTGLKPGLLTHVINNAHIYTNQIDSVKEQLARYADLERYDKKDLISENENISIDRNNKFEEVLSYVPKLTLNENIKEFKDFTADDIMLDGYTSTSGNLGKLYMGDVAV